MASLEGQTPSQPIPRQRPSLHLGTLPQVGHDQGSVDPRMLTPGGSSSISNSAMPAQFTPGAEYTTSPSSAHHSSDASRSWQEHYGTFSQMDPTSHTWAKPSSNSASSSESKPLKRYSACHTCRRRKLKCDGRRPTCTPCQRQKDSEGSSTSAANRIQPCIYDDAEDARQKERIKRSINSQLRVQANAVAKARGVDLSPPDRRRIKGVSGRPRGSYPDGVNFGTAPYPVSAAPYQSFLAAPPTQPSAFAGSFGEPLDQPKRPGMFKSFSYSGRSSVDTGTVSPISLHEGSPERISDSQYSVAEIQLQALGMHQQSDVPRIPEYQHTDSLLQHGWDQQLPPPELLGYLVNVLIHRTGGIGRVVDGNDIVSRLGVSSSDPRFPQLGLLHAVVAVASQDTPAGAAVAECVPVGYSYETVSHLLEAYSVSSTVFADQHASRAEAILNVTAGQTWANLELSQAYILLAKHWSNAYTTAKTILAPATAACLTLASGYTIDKSQFSDRSLNYQQARQGEHCAWMAYVLDCQGGVKGSVTPTLREHDMSLRLPTVLPMRPDDPVQYAPGTQTIQSHDLFNHHPACDSTVFLIKSAILLSRVQAFGDRVRRSVPAHYTALLTEADHHQAQMGVFYLCINEYMRTSSTGCDRDLLDALASTHLCGLYLDDAVKAMGHPTKASADPSSAVDRLVQLAASVAAEREERESAATPFSSFAFYQAGVALFAEKAAIAHSGDQAAMVALQNRLSAIRKILELAGKTFRSAQELFVKLDIMCGNISNMQATPMLNANQTFSLQPGTMHLPMIVTPSHDSTYQQWMPEPGAQSVPITEKTEWWSPNMQIMDASTFAQQQSLQTATAPSIDTNSGVPSLASASAYTSRHGSLSDSSRGLLHSSDGLLGMEPHTTTPSMDSATPADLAFSLHEWTNQT